MGMGRDMGDNEIDFDPQPSISLSNSNIPSGNDFK